MMKKILVLLLAVMLLPVVSAGADDTALTPVVFCLDWTPNTNHTGVYAAQALGYYREAGLDVKIVQPPEDGATLMCAAGQAQFSVTAQDSLAAALDRDEPLGVTAVAAILQHNTSGILARAGEGMDSPKGMEGRVYSTWESPVELAMLRWCMVKSVLIEYGVEQLVELLGLAALDGGLLVDKTLVHQVHGDLNPLLNRFFSPCLG